MSPDLPAPITSPAGPTAPQVTPEAPPQMEQISATELASLRRRADKYRFLFRTIVTVTSILAGVTLIIVLAAILTDM
jgi:hypothetical protein